MPALSKPKQTRVAECLLAKVNAGARVVVTLRKFTFQLAAMCTPVRPTPPVHHLCSGQEARSPQGRGSQLPWGPQQPGPPHSPTPPLVRIHASCGRQGARSLGGVTTSTWDSTPRLELERGPLPTGCLLSCSREPALRVSGHARRAAGPGGPLSVYTRPARTSTRFSAQKDSRIQTSLSKCARSSLRGSPLSRAARRAPPHEPSRGACREVSGGWERADSLLARAAPHPSPPSFPAAKKSIKVTFLKPDGSKQVVDAPVGDSMLEVAHANGIDIEGER